MCFLSVLTSCIAFVAKLVMYDYVCRWLTIARSMYVALIPYSAALSNTLSCTFVKYRLYYMTYAWMLNKTVLM